ncbi:hypothetical protein NFI96_008657 [Prochilodus magdalenae]|nr:hypothetical protein NFI96_008657 [Prochilodus magdalenae]
MSGGVAVLFAKSFIPCSYDVEEVVTGRLLKYTLNVTRDITRSLKALEMEIVELQDLGVSKGVLSGILKDLQVLSSAKVNWAKSEVFLVGVWKGYEPRLSDALHWKKCGFKYLWVYLGDGEFMKKNWEDVLERIKGRLMKWKWLVPKMSYV